MAAVVAEEEPLSSVFMNKITRQEVKNPESKISIKLARQFR